MLTYLSWGAYALGGAFLLATLFLETIFFIPHAVAAGVCGVAFMSAAKVIELLSDIRDRLPAAPRAAEDPAKRDGAPSPVSVRSLGELSADIERLRAKS